MYLNIGEQAPDFNLKNYTGDNITLKQLEGQDFLLWFFPKANTPG